jgi:cytochrome b
MLYRLTFWLDVALLLAFCALETVPFTGLVAHEWLGLVVACMIAAHMLLSWTWIASTSRRFLAISIRSRVNYLLNLTLFACAVGVIFSGIVISREAIPSLVGGQAGDLKSGWDSVHDTLSDFVLIFAGLHLAINWDWTVTAARKILRIGASL